MVHITPARRRTRSSARLDDGADRNGQLEIARWLQKVASPSTRRCRPGQIRSDITMRAIGLHRAAKQIYAALDPNSEVKRVLDAFAEGISAWNASLRAGELELPHNTVGFEPEAYTEWTAVDSLAMGRLQTFSLSYDADADIDLTSRFERVSSTFSPTATDPDLLKRANLAIDLFRFAPPDPATPLAGYPNEPLADWRAADAPIRRQLLPLVAERRAGGARSRLGTAAARAADATRPFFEAVARAKDFIGGDEFAGLEQLGGGRQQAASGNAMVANDPHLGRDSPMVFCPRTWSTNSEDPSLDWEIVGIAFPGIGVIRSNRTLAWAPPPPATT
jgi:penicillin amidase